MNRYQKPEVYDRLAMEYSLGTLKGQARKRFESLMEEQPYLLAIVEDNNRKFSPLVECLPEIKPDDHVWENISARLDAEPSMASDANHLLTGSEEATSWWNFMMNKGLAVAMMLLIVSAVFLLKPWGALDNLNSVDPLGYSATLVSKATQKPMVDVKVNKSDLLLTIKLKEPVEVPDNMRVVFWCIAKDKSMPIMNMGAVSAIGMTTKQLDKMSWKSIVDASEFAVSIEPVDTMANSSPSGDLIFVGKLRALTKT